MRAGLPDSMRVRTVSSELAASNFDFGSGSTSDCGDVSQIVVDHDDHVVKVWQEDLVEGPGVG